MKNTKKHTTLWSLALLVGLLAGTALTASAQSQISLGGGSQNVTFAPGGITSAWVSFGNCNGVTCSVGGAGAFSASPFALGVGKLADSNSAANSTFTFTSEVGTTGPVPGALALTLADGSSHPQFNIGPGDLRGGGADLSYMLNQLLCSSSTSGRCALQTISSTADGMHWDHWRHAKLTVAPEPTAAFLLGTGLLGIALLRRRKLAQPEA